MLAEIVLGHHLLEPPLHSHYSSYFHLSASLCFAWLLYPLQLCHVISSVYSSIRQYCGLGWPLFVSNIAQTPLQRIHSSLKMLAEIVLGHHLLEPPLHSHHSSYFHLSASLRFAWLLYPLQLCHVISSVYSSIRQYCGLGWPLFVSNIAQTPFLLAETPLLPENAR
jgi:hypothetical protein